LAGTGYRRLRFGPSATGWGADYARYNTLYILRAIEGAARLL